MDKLFTLYIQYSMKNYMIVKHYTLYIVFSMEKLILYILITLWTLLKMKFFPSLYPSLWSINPESLVSSPWFLHTTISNPTLIQSTTYSPAFILVKYIYS